MILKRLRSLKAKSQWEISYPSCHQLANYLAQASISPPVLLTRAHPHNLEVKCMVLRTRLAGSNPSTAAFWLCDFCQVVSCLYAWISSLVKWWQGFLGGSAVKNLPAMQETQTLRVQSLGQEDPLEKEMVTHSSILAWEIPWTEEPSGLQFMGPQKFGTQLSN